MGTTTKQPAAKVSDLVPSNAATLLPIWSACPQFVMCVIPAEGFFDGTNPELVLYRLALCLLTTLTLALWTRWQHMFAEYSNHVAWSR